MENVVSIRLEDFLEIRDRVLELEQELDSAHNEAQELRNQNFDLKKHIIRDIGTYGYAQKTVLSDYANIDILYVSSLNTLHDLGLTDIEIVSFLELIWREHNTEDKEEC